MARSQLRIRAVRSRQAVSSLARRVAFDLVDQVEPQSLARLFARRGGGQVPLDWQFENELERVRQFDRDLDGDGPYRLHPGAIFVKLRKRRSAAAAAGIVISLGHLDHLLANDLLLGERAGLRIDHDELDGH
ncbi:hypothetical protein K3177_14820 [Qipengyuania sp. GH25]|uniref:Uncharacterized protein n=1 Tax=Qipengyuania pacifica TaxID=2860199 RepID=A0ABS7JK68_9SPHN|nr:hypothetical protein [Qipengyuania aerophila]MBX7489779.1 hypothetical protein [Qipengyuania aerophila]